MRKEGSGPKQHPHESGDGGEATPQGRVVEEPCKSEARFRNLADTAPAMLWITEPDGSCSFLSRGWYEFTGQTEQEGLGQNGYGWLDAVHPDDRERAGRMFQDANKAGRPFSLDYRLRRHDGEYRWAIDAGGPRFGQNGEFLGYIGSVLDITERKEAEKAQTLLIEDLNRSQQYFRALFNWTPSAVGISTVAEGRLCDVNEGFSRLTGYTREELLGRTTLELGLWADPSERATVIQELQEQGSLHNREVPLRTKSGEIRCLMVTVDSIRLGSTPCLIYVAHDITERKRVDETLKQSEERFGSFVRSTDDGIVTLDRLGLITSWNPGAENLFGYAQDEVLGKPMTLLMPERFRERHERGIERASAAGHLAAAGNMFELAGLRKDGTEFPTEISLSSWGTRNGVFFTGIVRDITERKRAEALLEAEKKVLELIVTGAAMPEVLDKLMRETEAQSTDGMLCSVLQVDETGQRLLHGAAPSLSEAYNAAVHGLVIGPSAGSCGTAAFERKPVFVTDIAADPRWAGGKDLAATHGLGACHSAPILSSQARLLGTIAMYYRRPHNPSAHDRQLIERATHLAGIAIERKQTEEAFRRSEANLRDFVETAIIGLHWLGPDGIILWANQADIDLLGYTREEYIGHHIAEFHADAPVIEDVVARLARHERLREYEARLRCKDGSLRHVLIDSSALFEDGKFIHTRCFTRDITERKMAELSLQQNQEELRRQQAQLHELTANLLMAQEEERKRIARDLHDEFTQQLAALTIDLQSLSREAWESDAPHSDRLTRLGDRAEQLTTDLQRLAHQLHSSLLEQVGLEAGARELVEEFSARTGVTGEIVVLNLWDAVPLQLATCLYRVLQESLQNVRKHAEASGVLVRLVGTARGVGLCIHDDGRGFERSPDATKQTGLGLTSMAERVRSLHGTFHVWTKAGQGTEIHAWVPLRK